MTVIMAVEGILRKENKEPIPEGFMFFRVLATSYRVVLSSTGEEKELDHWMKTNYIFDYSELMDSSSAYEGQPLRMRHIELARVSGKIDLYIDSDPDMCAQALSMGIPTLLFATPKFFKASREIKPWGVITDEQERQKKLVAERYAKYVNSENGARWE